MTVARGGAWSGCAAARSMVRDDTAAALDGVADDSTPVPPPQPAARRPAAAAQARKEGRRAGMWMRTGRGAGAFAAPAPGRGSSWLGGGDRAGEHAVALRRQVRRHEV